MPNGSGKRVQAEADSSGRGGGKGEGGKVVRVWWFAIARRRRAPRADVGGTPPGPGRDGVCERVVGGRERRGPPGASCTAAPPTPVRSPVRAPPPLPRLRPPPARPPRRRNEPAEIHPPHPAPAVLPPPPPVSARPPADGPTPAPRTLAPRTRPYRDLSLAPSPPLPPPPPLPSLPPSLCPRSKPHARGKGERERRGTETEGESFLLQAERARRSSTWRSAVCERRRRRRR